MVLVAVTVAATVITVGAIPFVGLVIPNLVAMHYGEHLKKTLPIVAMSGALLLLACDILGRLLIYPFEVPIGLTAGSVGARCSVDDPVETHMKHLLIPYGIWALVIVLALLFLLVGSDWTSTM